MIDSVSSSGSQWSLLQMLQQQLASGQAGGSQGGNPLKAQIGAALGQMGLSAEEISDLQEQIGSAIQTAMESSNGGDLKTITDEAIAGVLEDNGIDVEEFDAIMESMAGQMGMPPAPGQGPPPGEFTAQLEAVGEQLGLSVSEVSDLKSQIDAAVQAATENLDDGSDPRAAIEEAVNGVLEDNGIDVEEFKSVMQSAAREMGPPPPPMYGPQGQMVSDETDSSSESSDAALEAIEELLAQLAAQSSDDSDSQASLISILQMLGNLPDGSLVNKEA
ncbi:MAG: hypothetical protein JXL80_14275 [Planctomycetes bacterium]|nr:hypothetical protein [Planctomycetota bacterium]